MGERARAERKQRILLSGVFGPFGVDDEFGRRENIMELFHNQVTRGQGLASFRFHHRSLGLYFLAANVDADVTVLDFPSRRRYVRELRRGYDLVGISWCISWQPEKAGTPNGITTCTLLMVTCQTWKC